MINASLYKKYLIHKVIHHFWVILTHSPTKMSNISTLSYFLQLKFNYL